MTVLRKRYLQKDADGDVVEKPSELFWRVARNLAQADALYGATEDEVAETAREFYEIMARLDFLPNSPTLMNAGNDLQQLSACFVLPVEDSLKDIFETLKHQALIHQSGGGTGFAFSRLRPKGDLVRSTMGVASGPVSFMRIFDAATQTVKQGGKRRGANMGILRVDHPDIRDFIHCKTGQGDVTNFNISVAITDEFMEAYRRDGEYDLVNPRTGEVVERLGAREIMDEIAEAAWRNGEPGLFFVDTTERKNPCAHIASFEATNPCVAGDTLVATASGLVPIEELAEGGSAELAVDVRAAASRQSTLQMGVIRAIAPRVWRSGVRPVHRLVTRSGYSIRATPDHRFLTPRGWRRLDTLRQGDKVFLQSGPTPFSSPAELPFVPKNEIRGRNGRIYRFEFPRVWSADLGFTLGWLIGDGWLRAGDKNCRVGFTFSPADMAAMRRVSRFMTSILGKRIKSVRRENGVYHLSYHSKFVADFFQRLGVGSWHSAEKRVPPTIFRAPREAVVGFLEGLFGADGTANYIPGSNAYVRLTSVSRNLMDGVQRLLIAFGIRSTIYRRTKVRPGSFYYVTVAGESRTYTSKRELFELSVSRSNVPRLLSLVGRVSSAEIHNMLLAHNYHSESFEDEVVVVEALGPETVYDLEEPRTHSFIANGFVTHNCGEQPLLPYESCNLGSLDLENHVKEEDGKWAVDWEKLEANVRLCVHLLDNVIDMNAYPVPEIEEMTKATRKIGLGVMGFARMLFRLGIPYDSEDGVEMGREVMRFIHDTGWDESQRLAEVRGVYPAWEGGSLHEKLGLRMRNSYVTTVAPTGTLSMIADTSGGCEPEFSLVWYKNVMDGEHLPYVLEMFVDVAKAEGFWSEGLLDDIIRNRGSVRGLAGVPEKWQRVFATSHDVSPPWHVRMQAAFQEHSDSAVSKTINLPAEATVEDVKEAYLLAYELGCKGITVYRDGSRPGQVMNVGVSDGGGGLAGDGAEPRAAAVRVRPRPDVIVGKTQKIQTPYGSLYVTINEDEHGLFEVFAQIGRGGGYTASFTEAVARLISLCLRSGIPVEQIVKQLEGIRSPRISWDHQERIYSVPDALGKAIQRHLAGGLQTTLQPRVDSFDENGLTSTDLEKEKEARDDLELLVRQGHNPECPECGSMLIFEEGCVKCHACGFSEC